MRKSARFIIDTHVHSQRYAAGPGLQERLKKMGKEKPDYSDLYMVMGDMDTYDNSKRLLYDMDCYGVDMCILQNAFSMSNELNLELVKKYPDKFRAMACAKQTSMKSFAGEEWTPEAAYKELDELLATGLYCGIGEGPLTHPNRKKTYNMSERLDELRLTMDLGRKYDVPVQIHSGTPGGYPVTYTRWPESWEPYWVHDLAQEYPDVTIIFAHGGMQGGYMEDLVDKCIQVASNHNNVYLETGLYWAELYYKALRYPNVGPEKLIWGTDWGTSIPIQTRIGSYPQSFPMQIHSQGLIKYQCDVMGWSLRQVEKLDISQDDINLILGGNALRIFKIDFSLTRMFRE